jgi:dTDP-4-dehydrorhamnose reductase
VKVLVLGGSGMLGHKVCEVFAPRFETYATVRSTPPLRLAAERVLAGVSAEDFESVRRAVNHVRPDALVNCIGIIKQLPAGKEAIPSITVNALFPHQLAEIAADADARMVQISTDCVFSGRKGTYTEDDEPDPPDLYGRTKLLGEATNDHTLTIRTSIVGRELSGANGLLEWFLSQPGPVRGFTKAIFSGLTTTELAGTLAVVLEEHRNLRGLWHVASEPIDKYELLHEFARVYERDVEIEPDDSVRIDRSLDDARFRSVTGTTRPTWSRMLDELARDPTPYDELRAVAC